MMNITMNDACFCLPHSLLVEIAVLSAMTNFFNSLILRFQVYILNWTSHRPPPHYTHKQIHFLVAISMWFTQMEQKYQPSRALDSMQTIRVSGALYILYAPNTVTIFMRSCEYTNTRTHHIHSQHRQAKHQRR